MSSGDGSGWESDRMQAWQQVRYRDNHPEATASTSNAASIDAGAHRDAAAHLATLLPSKQAQHTIGEVALNWLLSSENIPNEERAWEEIMRIKEMPVNMAQKKELKAQFKNANHGFEEVKWQRKKFWQRCKANFKDFFGKLELWQGSLKTIEGNFGVGVVSLFLFIKWLMFLNIFIFTLTFLLIVLPSAILEPGPSGQCDLAGNDSQSIACCVEQYQNYTSTSSDFFFFDLVQGTGWMEKTMLFYGHYTSEIYTLNNGLFYDLPFAYLISTLLYFLVSLIAIVKSAARGFRERIITGESQFYCNLIFAGWDFCFDKPKRMIYVQKAIFNEIKGCLEAERLQTERKIPTRKEKFRLLLSRVVVNTGIISILLASMVAIYYVFTLSRQLLRTYENSESRMLLLFFEFMPYLLIVSLNLLLPLLFTFLVDFEHYSPIVVVRITLLRTVFLRLSTLGVLGASIYPIVSCYRHDGCVCRDEAPLCWETYVGQQFYKLAMTNALSGIAVTFFINFPRAMIARYFEGNRFISFVCEQQFELPGHALDVVYSQTLCWIGSFYSPLLPAFAVVHCFLTFYVKKFACLVNSRPPSQIYRTSRSNYMFISVLLISFVAAAIAVGYSLTEVKPSRSCGPFKGDDPVWVTLWLSFTKLPSWIQGFASFLSTAGFTLPMIVLLLLALYYFNSVTAARRQMALVLRRQLLLEGQDKQFLLDQLNVIIEEQKHRQNTSSWNARYPQNLSFCSRRRTMKI